MTVYLLWFVPKDELEKDDALLVGVYDTETAAKAAIERLKTQPGFVGSHEGFQIHPRELNQDYWKEGFVVLD